MVTFIAALAGIAASCATLFGLSMAVGLLAEHIQLFRLLRLQPFRGVATWAMFSAAIWLGVITFGSIVG